MLIPFEGQPLCELTQLEMVEKSTGIRPPELDEYYNLECPEDYLDYWQDFLQLNKQRTFTESGPCALSFLDLEAWASLFGISTTPHQLDVILMLDSIWMKVYRAHRKS